MQTLGLGLCMEPSNLDPVTSIELLMSRIKHHLSTKAEAIIDGWHGPVIDPNNPWKLSDDLFYGGPNAHDTINKLELPKHAEVDQIELVGIQTTSNSTLNMMA